VAPVALARGGRRDGTEAALSKSERAAKRRREAVQVEGVSVLESASIRSGTRAYYLDHWREFQRFAQRQSLATRSVLEVDAALALLLEETFFEGENVGVGEKLFASVLFFRHQCSKEAGGAMPSSRRALRGWRKLAPPHSRLPLAYEVIALFVNFLLAVGLREVALVVLLSVELYLRPGEAFTLRAIDLVPPFRRRVAHEFWALTLHAAESGVASKTSEFDESLRLDLPRQAELGPALDKMLVDRWGQRWRLTKAASGGAPLFTVTAADVTKGLAKAAAKFGLKAHPYQLRHGGASHDFATGARGLEAIRRRGRWQSWHSLRRYEKGARTTEMLHQLRSKDQALASRCADCLPALVAERQAPFLVR